jgi:hypothetical protein
VSPEHQVSVPTEGRTPSKLWVVFGSEMSGGEVWDQRTEKD